MAMPSVIPQTPSVGEKLGESFGTGLSSGLQALANMKLQQIQQKYQQDQYRGALQSAGYTPQESQLISLYPPEVQVKFMQALGPGQPQEQIAPTQGVMNTMQQLQAPQQAAEKISPVDQTKLQQLLQTKFAAQPSQQPYQNMLMAAATGKPASPYADMLKTLNPAQIQQLSAQAAQASIKPTAQPLAAKGIPKIPKALVKEAQAVATQRKNLREAIATYETPQMKLQRELAEKSMSQKERREAHQQRTEAFKMTAKYREKVLDTELQAREALGSIKEAQELEKNGEFPSQQFASFLKGAEWEDIPGFLTGSAEAFNKVLANFQRGAKDIYGGKITNFEMQQFLRTIPTLQHTPEGRKRIWSMMQKYYRGAKEIGKLERNIIAANDGVPPEDLHEQVNAKFKPIAKDIARKFKKDLKKAEELQSSTASRLGSIASYGAGKAAKAIPGALKGAAIGAGVGSVVPGLGTATGALAGGGLGALSGGEGLSGLLKLLL